MEGISSQLSRISINDRTVLPNRVSPIRSEMSDLERSETSRTSETSEIQFLNNLLRTDITSLSKSEVLNIIESIGNNTYLHGDGVLPDSVYDKLIDFYNEKFNEDYIAPENGDLSTPEPMGTLKKARTQKELNLWMTTHPAPYLIADKYDGVSTMVVKRNNQVIMFSKGGGRRGGDPEKVKLMRPEIPFHKLPEDLPIRGELIISKTNYSKLSGFKTPRAVASSFMSNDFPDPQIGLLLDFVAYKVYPKREDNSSIYDHYKYLYELGFQVPKFSVYQEMPSEQQLREIVLNEKKNYDYDIDGLVINSLDKSMRVTVPEGKRLEYAIAFKVDPEGSITKVIGMNWNISANGKITPVGLIDTVYLKTGVNSNGEETFTKINKVTCNNARYVIDNRIGIGAIVRIAKKGDIIPGIVSVEQGSDDIVYPPFPYEWNENKVDFITTSVTSEMINGLINNMAKILEVKGMGPKKADELREEFNIKSMEQLITNHIFTEDDRKDFFLNIAYELKSRPIEYLMAVSGLFAKSKAGLDKISKFMDLFRGYYGEIDPRRVPDLQKLTREARIMKTSNEFIDALLKFSDLYYDNYMNFLNGRKINLIPEPVLPGRTSVASRTSVTNRRNETSGNEGRGSILPGRTSITSRTSGRSGNEGRSSILPNRTSVTSRTSIPRTTRLSPLPDPIETIYVDKIYNPALVAFFMNKPVYNESKEELISLFLSAVNARIVPFSQAEIVIVDHEISLKSNQYGFTVDQLMRDLKYN